MRGECHVVQNIWHRQEININKQKFTSAHQRNSTKATESAGFCVRKYLPRKLTVG